MLATTTCQKLVVRDDAPATCDKPLGDTPPILTLDPVDGSMREMLLCQDCRDEYRLMMTCYLHGAPHLPWSRYPPVPDASGRYWTAQGARQILAAAGVTVSAAGALSASTLAQFRNISPPLLKALIKANPELEARVLAKYRQPSRANKAKS